MLHNQLFNNEYATALNEDMIDAITKIGDIQINLLIYIFLNADST